MLSRAPSPTMGRVTKMVLPGWSAGWAGPSRSRATAHERVNQERLDSLDWFQGVNGRKPPWDFRICKTFPRSAAFPPSQGSGSRGPGAVCWGCAVSKRKGMRGLDERRVLLAALLLVYAVSQYSMKQEATGRRQCGGLVGGRRRLHHHHLYLGRQQRC